jgi:hypothetical protein
MGKHEYDEDASDEESRIKASIYRWGSDEVLACFDDFQAFRSTDTIDLLAKQVRKELRRSNRRILIPTRPSLWMTISLVVIVAFASYYFLTRYVLPGGLPDSGTQSAARKAGTSPGPTPSPVTIRRSARAVRRKEPRKPSSSIPVVPSPASRPTADASSAAPSAESRGTSDDAICPSCVIGGVSRSLNEAVQGVQPVVGSVLGLLPSLGESVSQPISGLLAPTLTTLPNLCS